MECIDDTISMMWFIDFNIEINHDKLLNWGGGAHIWAKYKDHATSNLTSVEVKF
jgi:hypothetical protein